MEKVIMTLDVAKDIIGDGSEWDVEGKTYWVSTDEHYTLDGRLSYFRAVELGKEYEDEDELYDEEGVYVAFPLIDEDDERFNPEPEEWCAIYDERYLEVWAREPW